GETYSGDREQLRYYVDPQRMLDGQFDFALRSSIISTVMMRSTFAWWENKVIPTSMKGLEDFLRSNATYYGDGTMSTFLGNHDMGRAIHFGEDTPFWFSEWDTGASNGWSNVPALPSGTSAFERLANAFTVLFSLPGIPLIYYGDEIGMPGGGDPDNRRMMDFDPSHYTPGQQLLREHMRKLGTIRNAHVSLRRGERVSLSVTDETIAYQMRHEADSVYVLVNRADVPQRVSGLPEGTYEDLLTGRQVTGPQAELSPRSSMLLIAKP
ncbi:alpha-amylase family glycosyl hydrolase, partial [Archangium sp.]|uniref:alpha-amylase family glycosyl hydrolase n=1 Tax=Archangium sp. TaxID=1872627 RepID=UPI002EDA7303